MGGGHHDRLSGTPQEAPQTYSEPADSFKLSSLTGPTSSNSHPDLKHSDSSSDSSNYLGSPNPSTSKPPQWGQYWQGKRPSSWNPSKGPNGAEDTGLDCDLHGTRALARIALLFLSNFRFSNCPSCLANSAKCRQCSNCQLKTWDGLMETVFREHQHPFQAALHEHGRKTILSVALFEEFFGILGGKSCQRLIQKSPPIVTLMKRDQTIQLVMDKYRMLVERNRRLAPGLGHIPIPITLPARLPEDDEGNLTETVSRRLRLLSDDLRRKTQGASDMSTIGLYQIEAKKLNVWLQMWMVMLPAKDAWPSQVSRLEDITSQGTILKVPAAAQDCPSNLELPQGQEILEDEFGGSPSTSSIGSSQLDDTDFPLFTSIRRILLADPSYDAEEVISTIKQRSYGRNLDHASSTFKTAVKTAIFDSPRSVASDGQESTSQGCKKRHVSTSGRSKSQANKKQKTCAPSNAEEDDEDESRRDEDGGGKDGRREDDIPPHPTPDESFDGWVCPYCLKYVEITCIKDFQACGRPGFRYRDDLSTHLQRRHSPKAQEQYKKDGKGLAQYCMSPQQWTEVQAVTGKTERPRKKKDPQKWLEVQMAWYSKIWAIIFPDSQYVPDSPFHTSNKELGERCRKAVESMMEIERERDQALGFPSCADSQIFNRYQVQQMLEKAIQIGLDSLPLAAQHFGKREFVATKHTESLSSTSATSPKDEAECPTSDESHPATLNGEATSSEDEGSLTPENTLSIIQKTVTPEPCPSQSAVKVQQSLSPFYHPVPLENKEQKVSITFKPRKTHRAIDLTQEALVKVTAPLNFSVVIEDALDIPGASVQNTAPLMLPVNSADRSDLMPVAPLNNIASSGLASNFGNLLGIGAAAPGEDPAPLEFLNSKGHHPDCFFGDLDLEGLLGIGNSAFDAPSELANAAEYADSDENSDLLG